MNKANQLYKNYEDKLAELQKTCVHEFISDWSSVYWAPGHLCDYDAQFCKECSKEIHKKSWCDSCGKELINDEMKESDGVGGRPYGCSYCAECLTKPYDITKRVTRQTLSAWEKRSLENG